MDRANTGRRQEVSARVYEESLRQGFYDGRTSTPSPVPAIAPCVEPALKNPPSSTILKARISRSTVTVPPRSRSRPFRPSTTTSSSKRIPRNAVSWNRSRRSGLGCPARLMHGAQVLEIQSQAERLGVPFSRSRWFVIPPRRGGRGTIFDGGASCPTRTWSRRA